MARTSKYRLVRIEWLDSETYGTGEPWQDRREAHKSAKRPPGVIDSAGFVLHDSETHIEISQSVSSNQVSGTTLKVVKQQILKVWELCEVDV